MLNLWKARERVQLLVVLNVQSTTNSSQLREVKLLQLVVLVDRKRLTNRLQLREFNGLESVGLQRQRAVDGSQVSNGKRRNVLEFHIVGTGQLVQDNLNLVSVVVNGQEVSHRLQTRVDRLNVGVVVDVESLKFENVNTVQRGQTSVLDGNFLGGGQTGCQTSLLQSWQSIEGQRTDSSQLSKVDSRQDGGVRNSQVTSNQLQSWGVKNGSLGTIDEQATVNGLDSVQFNASNALTANGDVTDSGSASSNLRDLGGSSSSEVTEGARLVNRRGSSGQRRV